MKLIGLIFLGLIASSIVYALLFMLFIKLFSNIGEAGLLITVLIITPLSFLIGSFPTGYFSYYDIEEKRSLLLMVPALYFNLVWMIAFSVMFLVNAFVGVNEPPRYGFIIGLLIPAGIGLLWYLASLAGVMLGYFLRDRYAKWWYGD